MTLRVNVIVLWANVACMPTWIFGFYPIFPIKFWFWSKNVKVGIYIRNKNKNMQHVDRIQRFKLRWKKKQNIKNGSKYNIFKYIWVKYIWKEWKYKCPTQLNKKHIIYKHANVKNKHKLFNKNTNRKIEAIILFTAMTKLIKYGTTTTTHLYNDTTLFQQLQ